MTTRFTFEDDKELVQLASACADAGTRIAWADIAQRMQRTGHNARALQERLRTLKKTWGADIRRFPPSFFTPVQRPRGRPPRATRELCQGASTTQHRQHEEGPSTQQQSSTGDGQERPQLPGARIAVRPPLHRHGADSQRGGVETTPQQQQQHSTAHQSPVASSATQASATQSPIASAALPVIQALPTTQVPPASTLSLEHGTSLQRPRTLATGQALRPTSLVGASLEVAAVANTVNDEDVVRCLSGGSSSVSSPGVSDDGRSPPMSPSSGEHAVAEMFSDIPREVVVQGANNMPHRNAGELMSRGISTLLRELGGLDRNDIFLDIGSGVGNVAAQVALATSVSKVIGIEIRRDLYDLGVKMMAKSTKSRRLLEQVQLVCQDIADMHISTTPTYADVTVVFWNNLLFEPQVVEVVKEELAGMFMLKKLVSSLNFCPRHRDVCHNPFCQAFKLEKVLDLPCSWKADLQQIFAYESL